MTITIGLGWWLAPLGVTIVAVFLAWVLDRPSGPSTAVGSIVDALQSAVLFGAAIIVSLLAWLIWVVLT